MKFINFDLLTPREADVIRVMYCGRKNDLGLSPEYFQSVLDNARSKLGIDPETKKVGEKHERYNN